MGFQYTAINHKAFYYSRDGTPHQIHHSCIHPHCAAATARPGSHIQRIVTHSSRAGASQSDVNLLYRRYPQRPGPRLTCCFFALLFSCWGRQSSKGTTEVPTAALSREEARREAASRPACLSRPTARPARCISTPWRSTPALSLSNTAVATAANPTCLPCMVTLWDPILRRASSTLPACWPTTAAAATSPMITSLTLQILSTWLREGLLQSATTLTTWLWAQMGLCCSGPLLMPTVPCSWGLPDSLLSLETPHRCRVSPQGIPHLPSKVSSKETPLRLFKGWWQETSHPKAWHHETSPLRAWWCETWRLRASETVSVIWARRAWHLRSLPPRATTTSQKPSWRLSTKDGRWRRGGGCCASRPDPRHSTARMWGSMTSPAGGAYRQKTSDRRAPADRLPRPTAPGSSSWAQASSVMAWGPRLSPAPPRRRWPEARRRPAPLCRAAAAAASKARAGLPLRLTAILTDRLSPSLPLHPPCPV